MWFTSLVGRPGRGHAWKQTDQSEAITMVRAGGNGGLYQSSSNVSDKKYLNSKSLSKLVRFIDRVNAGYERERETALQF